MCVVCTIIFLLASKAVFERRKVLVQCITHSPPCKNDASFGDSLFLPPLFRRISWWATILIGPYHHQHQQQGPNIGKINGFHRAGAACCKSKYRLKWSAGLQMVDLHNYSFNYCRCSLFNTFLLWQCAGWPHGGQLVWEPPDKRPPAPIMRKVSITKKHQRGTGTRICIPQQFSTIFV